MNLNFSARNAWKCFGIIFLLWLLLATSIAIAILHLHAFQSWWSESLTARLIFSFADFAVIFIPTLYFARVRSFSQFITAFGLSIPPNNKAWPAILWMILIQSLAFIAAHWGLPNRGLNPPNMAIANSSEVILYFLPLFIAPFWEEIVMRGFFYQAFRGSYSKLTSTLLVVGITAFTHQSQFFGSIPAAVGLSGFVVALCWLMEHTHKIWNCILAHLAFNGIFILISFMHH